MSAHRTMEVTPPAAPYLDRERDAWVLSRYADVLAAFREPRLWPVAARGEDQSKTRDDAGRLRLRPEVQEALPMSRVAAWRERMEALALASIAHLPTDRPVDLLGEYAQPLCLDLALLVLGAGPGDRARLADLGERVFAATGASHDSPLRPAAAAATAEMERIFQNGPIPMGEPTFVALSQTLPRLMANAWVALLQHPSEMAQLRARPGLLPDAVEEFLRYAGIVRGVWRRATVDLELAGVSIAAGQRVMLMLASANRDPAQFPEPDRLDVTRRFAGHMALGTGRNSCVGATLVRMAMAAATGPLLQQLQGAELNGLPEWRAGSGYCFPTSVPVRLSFYIRPTLTGP
jgi:cytochrome P450